MTLDEIWSYCQSYGVRELRLRLVPEGVQIMLRGRFGGDFERFFTVLQIDLQRKKTTLLSAFLRCCRSIYNVKKKRH